MEIIILFAIIGIISSVIKNAAKTQQQPPVVRRRVFEDLVGKISPEGVSSETTSSGWDQQEDRMLSNESNPYVVPKITYGADAADAYTGIMGEADPLQVVSIDGGQKKEHKLDFSEENVINGIIFSEILSPPKSLRR